MITLLIKVTDAINVWFDGWRLCVLQCVSWASKLIFNDKTVNIDMHWQTKAIEINWDSVYRNCDLTL